MIRQGGVPLFRRTGQIGSSLARALNRKRSVSSETVRQALGGLDVRRLASETDTEKVADYLAKEGYTDALTRVTVDRSANTVFGVYVEIGDTDTLSPQVDLMEPGVYNTWGLKHGSQEPFNPLTVRYVEAMLHLEVSAADHSYMANLMDQHEILMNARLRVKISGSDAEELCLGSFLQGISEYVETTTDTVERTYFRGNPIWEPPGLEIIDSEDTVSLYLQSGDEDTILESNLTTGEVRSIGITFQFTCEAL